MVPPSHSARPTASARARSLYSLRFAESRKVEKQLLLSRRVSTSSETMVGDDEKRAACTHMFTTAPRTTTVEYARTCRLGRTQLQSYGTALCQIYRYSTTWSEESSTASQLTGGRERCTTCLLRFVFHPSEQVAAPSIAHTATAQTTPTGARSFQKSGSKIRAV